MTFLKLTINYFINFFGYGKKLDKTILTSIIALFLINIVVQFSANDQQLSRVINDIVYLVFALVVMFIVANINLEIIKSNTKLFYAISLILILLVLVIGVRVNGAQRWLNLGIRIQPSEFCKISVPLMVAYYLSTIDGMIRAKNYLICFIIFAIPFALVAKQPDLGTAILIFVAGFWCIFFAGLPWKAIISSMLLLVVSSPFLWLHLHDYQKQRIMTLIDPQSDPLGTGYHIIQGIIAIGSGGLTGKGYLQGTQVHLNFIPEKHTDFVVTVLSEEFGFVGVCVVLFFYLLIILRGLSITKNATDLYTKVLAGSITMSLLFYVMINMGMVSGIFPVVGVPLPFISYGGTSTVILMFGLGLLLSIDNSSKYNL